MRSAAGSLPGQTLGLLAAMVGLHFWLAERMLDHGLKLGAVSHKLAPLYAYWRPHFKTGLLIAVALLVPTILWFLRRGLSREVSARRWLATVMLAHLVLALAVATIDGKGLARIAEPYTRTDLEFIGLVPLVESPRWFLASYADRLPELPMHAQTHGPGAGVLLWAVDRYVAPGPAPAALATILLSVLSLPAVYLWGRELLPETGARLATMLCVLAPNFTMFTATSMDAVFAVPLVWSCCSFWKAWSGKRTALWGTACGLAAAVAAMFTFSMAFLALWGLAVLGLSLAVDRGRARNTARALLWAALGFLAFYVLVDLWSGYNILHMLHAAVGTNHEIMAGVKHDSLGQHVHLTVGNLAVFAGCSGLALSVLWLRELRAARPGPSADRPERISPAGLLVWSFTLALVTLAALPLYAMEVERIWIFMVPFLSLAAASYLIRDRETLTARARFVMFALAGQTVVTEMLLTTYW